jgi:hypothetical protein
MKKYLFSLALVLGLFSPSTDVFAGGPPECSNSSLEAKCDFVVDSVGIDPTGISITIRDNNENSKGIADLPVFLELYPDPSMNDGVDPYTYEYIATPFGMNYNGVFNDRIQFDQFTRYGLPGTLAPLPGEYTLIININEDQSVQEVQTGTGLQIWEAIQNAYDNNMFQMPVSVGELNITNLPDLSIDSHDLIIDNYTDHDWAVENIIGTKVYATYFIPAYNNANYVSLLRVRDVNTGEVIFAEESKNVTYRVSFMEDSSRMFTIFDNRIIDNTLSQYYQTPFSDKLVPGHKYEVYLELDSQNEIVESNEDNNVSLLEFVFPTPISVTHILDSDLEKVTANLSLIQHHDNYLDIEAEICNSGHGKTFRVYPYLSISHAEEILELGDYREVSMNGDTCQKIIFYSSEISNEVFKSHFGLQEGYASNVYYGIDVNWIEDYNGDLIDSYDFRDYGNVVNPFSSQNSSLIKNTVTCKFINFDYSTPRTCEAYEGEYSDALNICEATGNEDSCNLTVYGYEGEEKKIFAYPGGGSNEITILSLDPYSGSNVTHTIKFDLGGDNEQKNLSVQNLNIGSRSGDPESDIILLTADLYNSFEKNAEVKIITKDADVLGSVPHEQTLYFNNDSDLKKWLYVVEYKNGVGYAETTYDEFLPGHTYEITLSVDPNNLFQESNENDNKKSILVSIPEQYVDGGSEYEQEVITAPQYSAFSDAPTSTQEGLAAAFLKQAEIIGGFPDGEFKGYRPVNRAEAAKFLLLAKGIEVGNLQNNGKFWDVLDGEWYTKYVMKAYQLGILNGYPDGTFRPADTVDTAEFLKMLTLTFDLPVNLSHSYSDVPAGEWFAKYAGIAEKYDMFDDAVGRLFPYKELTRKEVAIAIFRYLFYSANHTVEFKGNVGSVKIENRYLSDVAGSSATEVMVITLKNFTTDEDVSKNPFFAYFTPQTEIVFTNPTALAVGQDVKVSVSYIEMLGMLLGELK